MSHITQVGIRRPPENHTAGEAASGKVASKVPAFPKLLFQKGANGGGRLADEANTLSSRQQAGRVLQGNGCAAMLEVHMRRAPPGSGAVWHSETLAAAAPIDHGRPILKSPPASTNAAHTPQAIVNALQRIFAPIAPWVSVSVIKSELQAMQADAVKENEFDMSPEDLAVLAMSPEQLEHFKAVFEAEFQNMAFEGIPLGDPLQ
jgi:hypothetical protein